LAAPFTKTLAPELLSRLEPLVVDNGFTAIITTNYDHSLHDARAHATRTWFSPVERGDGTLRGATVRRVFFIERIHGRADPQETMVVDSQDYAVWNGRTNPLISSSTYSSFAPACLLASHSSIRQ